MRNAALFALAASLLISGALAWAKKPKASPAPTPASSPLAKPPLAADPLVTATPLAPAELEALVKRGRVLYQTRCVVCHGHDPKEPGTLGPEVHGASRELLEARILHESYPPGYVPKRSTRAMKPMPELASGIAALHAYLNARED
ncbi:MAG: cytochrome c [Oligoflexia bacterium]|nr:cytochrome c [Oligoflexia bacterium]